MGKKKKSSKKKIAVKATVTASTFLAAYLAGKKLGLFDSDDEK